MDQYQGTLHGGETSDAEPGNQQRNAGPRCPRRVSEPQCGQHAHHHTRKIYATVEPRSDEQGYRAGADQCAGSLGARQQADPERAQSQAVFADDRHHG